MPKIMKKDQSALELKIVETALRMFNERGIEYVGMRELASAMGISIGNLNYYFPTKDQLVDRLSINLGAENSAIIVEVDNITMPVFFAMLSKVFENHLKYRCLLLSFVHVVQQNPAVAKRYAKTQRERSSVWSRNVDGLIRSGNLKSDGMDVEYLVSTIALIARFWISEAAISSRGQSESQQIAYYVNMIARIFLPYATPKARRFLNLLLDVRKSLHSETNH